MKNKPLVSVIMPVYNTKDFVLQDTPDIQTLILSDTDEYYKGNIQLEILEVYMGSKYSDVVISGIYFIESN